MAGAVFALSGGSEFGHMLGEDVSRRHAFDEERTDVADHRGHPILFLESVGAADRDGFLAETGIEAADDFILAKEASHGFFDLAVKAHVVIEVEILLAGKFCGFRFGEGLRSRHFAGVSESAFGSLSYG